MIFAKGDHVRYHGGILVERAHVLQAGDAAFVTEPNEDLGGDVRVVIDSGMSFLVSAEDLEWLAGA